MIGPARTRATALWPEPPKIETRPIPWFTMIMMAGLVFLVGHTLSTTAAVPDWSDSLRTTADSIAEGSLRRRFGFLLMGVWGAVMIVLVEPRYKLRLRGFPAWLMLGFLVWAALTIVWADDSPLATRRFVTLCLVTVAVVGLLRQFSLRDVVLFITLSSLVYVLIGVAAELRYGAFHPLSGGYRFAGTQHPNHQGMNLARLVLGAFCLSKMKVTGRRLFLAVVFIGLVFLILTRSRTAFGAALVALAVFAGIRLPPLRLTVVLFAAAAVGFLTLFLIQNQMFSTPWELILMGRKTVTAGTLSGRTELWEYLWTFVVERPVQGFGYHSFMSPKRAGDMPSLLSWGVSESHSLYFEIALGTGMVGLGLFLGAVLGSISRALRWTGRSRNPAHAFLAAYLVFVVVNGIMAATTMFPDPKLPAVLVLGYLLLRDPAQEAGEMEPAPDRRTGRIGMPAYGIMRPGVPGRPAGMGPPPLYRPH